MSFFTTRERAEFGNEKRMDRKVRDVVRSEFAPRRRRPDSDLPGHVDSVMRQRPADNNLGGHVGSVIQQVTESFLQEIDDLIVVLRRRREELLSESAHVQRAVIEYAKLSQSTMQSARLITESLSHLNRVSAPPRNGESHVGDVSKEHRDSGSAGATQYGWSSGRNRTPRSSDVSDLPEETSGPSISRDGDTDDRPRPSLAASDPVPAEGDSA